MMNINRKRGGEVNQRRKEDQEFVFKMCVLIMENGEYNLVESLVVRQFMIGK